MCFMFIMCLVGCNENQDSKIKRVKDISQYLDEDFNKNEINKAESWSGIEVWIFCDYSKHINYDEWIKKYNLKTTYESNNAKYKDNYFDLLNTACYELIHDNFLNGEFTSICTGEFLYFTYDSQVELDKDYEKIEKISKEDYVVKVVIKETKGISNVDE